MAIVVSYIRDTIISCFSIVVGGEKEQTQNVNKVHFGDKSL